jgi:hypothetical protein
LRTLDKLGFFYGSVSDEENKLIPGRVREQDFLAKPGSDVSGVSQMLSEGLVPLLGGTPQGLLCMKSGIEEKL